MAIRLEDLLASFRRHLRTAAKASRTIELYSQSVRYFSRWLTDRSREPVLDELTRHAIAAWLAELAETAEPSTVGTRLRGMRRFCRWLVTEGELEKAPTDGIEIPSPPDKPVPILTDEEIAALLKACAVGRGRPGVFERTVFLGRRDEVVLRLLLDTGVRVSELCGLGLTDVDLDRELAYVTGKGSRPRVVPFGARTAQAVDRYLRVRALHQHARSRDYCSGSAGRCLPTPPATSSTPAPRRPASPTWAAPVPAHLCPPPAGRWWAGAGPDDAGRLAQRRHAVPLRRLHGSRARPRGAPASRSGRPTVSRSHV